MFCANIITRFQLREFAGEISRRTFAIWSCWSIHKIFWYSFVMNCAVVFYVVWDTKKGLKWLTRHISKTEPLSVQVVLTCFGVRFKVFINIEDAKIKIHKGKKTAKLLQTSLLLWVLCFGFPYSGDDRNSCVFKQIPKITTVSFSKKACTFAACYQAKCPMYLELWDTAWFEKNNSLPVFLKIVFYRVHKQAVTCNL